MAQMQIRLLGPPRIDIDGSPLRITRKKGLALLAYLTVSAEAQSRETLATLLWPESDGTRARTSLRRDLWEMTRALGEGWLQVARARIGLSPQADIWSDVSEFGSGTGGREIEALTIPELERLVELYRADFMAGFSLNDSVEFDDWQFYHAESYRMRIVAILEHLIDRLDNEGDFRVAIPHARRWLVLDPLHEPAQRSLISLLAKAGQKRAALRQYESCVQLLDSELGVPPEPATTSLYETVRDGRLDAIPTSALDIPSAHTLVVSSPHNLPTASTSFVGRESEAQTLLERLTGPDHRLITLTGMGGVGKTRLALEVARRAEGLFPDGRYLVRLSHVEASGELLNEIIRIFPAAEDESDPMRRLKIALGSKRILLIIDNFEHLLDQSAVLSTLLQSLGNLKILATSRVRLALREETLFPLDGLTYTAAGADPLETPAALTLFIDRARRVQPDFDAAADKEHALEICELVEGVPLSIELAAGWLRLMPCTELVDQLRTNLDLLASSTRNMPERQRSQRAVFESSWALLDEEAQRALRRLAIFSGSYTLRNAMEVTGVSLDAISRLIDASWMRTDTDGRIQMHRLIRHYAAERLSEVPGERAELSARHADHYSRLISNLPWPYSSYLGVATTEEIQKISADWPEIERAWMWAVEAEEHEILRRMRHHVVAHLRQRGTQAEGVRLVDSALSMLNGANRERNSALLASLLIKKAMIYENDSLDERLRVLSDALSLLADDDDPLDHLSANLAIGMTLADLGEKVRAQVAIDRAYAIVGRIDDPLVDAHVNQQVGLVYGGWGEMRRAIDLFGRAQEAYASINGANLISRGIFMGWAYTVQGRFKLAQRYLQRSLVYFSDSAPNSILYAHSLRNMGELLILTGDFPRARELWQRAESLYQEHDATWWSDLGLNTNLGVLERLEGDQEAAERYLERALGVAHQVGWAQRVIGTLNQLSRLRQEQEEMDEAEQLAQEALKLAETTHNAIGVAQSLRQLGAVALNWDLDAAFSALLRGLAITHQHHIYRVSLDIVLEIGRVQQRLGDTEKAVETICLVRHHPYSDFEARRNARRLLSALAPDGINKQASPEGMSITTLRTLEKRLLEGHLKPANAG